MSISGAKIAVLLGKGFQDQELTEPVKALRDAGAEVTLIGLSQSDKDGVTGKHGTVAKADSTIDEVRPDDFDMLVIPGGKGPSHLRQDQRVLDFVRAIDGQAKPVAAICHGPQVLVSANLLKGRTATSYFTVAGELRGAGARYVNKPVVVDGNLITSRDVKDIPAFVETLFSFLERQERKTA